MNYELLIIFLEQRARNKDIFIYDFTIFHVIPNEVRNLKQYLSFVIAGLTRNRLKIRSFNHPLPPPNWRGIVFSCHSERSEESTAICVIAG